MPGFNFSYTMHPTKRKLQAGVTTACKRWIFFENAKDWTVYTCNKSVEPYNVESLEAAVRDTLLPKTPAKPPVPEVKTAKKAV